MSRIKRLVRPDTQASNWKAAVPAIALAVASLVGCAQTAVAGQTPGTAPASTAASSNTTHPIADFSSCKKPMYPKLALSNKVTGTVTLGYLVGTNGSVRDSTVKKSSGDTSLDEAARVAIAKCKFAPATSGGKPVEEWAQVQYVWSLH